MGFLFFLWEGTGFFLVFWFLFFEGKFVLFLEGLMRGSVLSEGRGCVECFCSMRCEVFSFFLFDGEAVLGLGFCYL